MIPKFSHPQKHWLLRRKVWDSCHWSWRIHGNKSRAGGKFLQFYWMETPWDYNWSPCCGFLHLQFFKEIRPRLQCVCACYVVSFVSNSLTLWTVVWQASMSMGFCRQEYWSRLPCPLPGDLPDPRIKPKSLTSPALAGGLFTTHSTWKPKGLESAHRSQTTLERVIESWWSKELLSYEDLVILVERIWQETI